MEKKDVYQIITDRIVASLENGVRPWMKPWAGDGLVARPLRANGAPYTGINVLILWAAAEEKGYTNPSWMTFKQAKAFGGNVRKGEKGEMIVFFSKLTVADENSETGERKIGLLRNYTVFNVQQIDGLPANFYAASEPKEELDPSKRIPRAEEFFEHTGAKVVHSGGRAYYMPSQDMIRLPAFGKFRDAASYYATRGHETIHWTMHETRLNRDFGRQRWGDEGYAMEELVAEIGSAFLCADLGIVVEPRDDHAQYLAVWLKVLKDDKKAIFTAASHADKAVTFLHGLQPGAAEEDDEEADMRAAA